MTMKNPEEIQSEKNTGTRKQRSPVGGGTVSRTFAYRSHRRRDAPEEMEKDRRPPVGKQSREAAGEYGRENQRSTGPLYH